MLRELYQQLIIDHGRNPRNFGELEDANHQQQGLNPLCGDELTVFFNEKDGKVIDVSFVGQGCAISVASASLMTDLLKGKTVAEAKTLYEQFHQLVTGKVTVDELNNDELDKLVVLAGVANYPARVKCATLAWHAAMAALSDETKPVSTEA